jgi:HemY protein
MRTWFWTLLLAVIAVAVAVMLRAHPGNVLVLVAPYRIEISLTLAVFLLFGGFIALYVILRVLAWLIAIPDRMRAWRGRRAQARDHDLLERGWIGLLEGRYAQAEKDLAKLLDQTRARNRRVLAALSAARAAQGLGEFVRRDVMLDRARESAERDPGLQEAVATVSADLFLEQGRPQQALEVLAPLQDGGARHLHTLRLLLRAERALGHHDKVFTLARGLARRGVVDRTEALQIIDAAGAARLRARMQDDSWRAVWKDMKSEERQLPEIALAAAAAFDAAGESEEGGRVLQAAIDAHFDPRLVYAYARCDASQVPRRVQCAETWLQRRPADPDLLSALGMLCLSGQLWGQAERYLTRSLARRDDARTHALLGSLYDRVDRPAEAVRHWRLATAAGMTLPVLGSDTALPAADTHADPNRPDAESGFLSDAAADAIPMAPASPPEPVAPPAVDYVLDPQARAQVEHDIADAGSRANPVAPPGPVDIDDYFDSAPIPVAGLPDDGDQDEVGEAFPGDPGTPRGGPSGHSPHSPDASASTRPANTPESKAPPADGQRPRGDERDGG